MKKIFLNITREQFYELYITKNMKLRDIAKLLHINVATLEKNIKEKGFSDITKEKKLDVDKFYTLYNNGVTIKEICKELNVSDETLYKLIRKNNITLKVRKNHNYIDVPNLDYARLKQLYVEQDLSVKEISDLYNVTCRKIERMLTNYKIKKKSLLEKYNISKEELYDLYITQNLTRRDIAQKLNTTKEIISVLLKKLDIKKQEKAKELINISREELYDLYITQNKTAKEIAEMYNYPVKTLGSTLYRYNIIKPKELVYKARARTMKQYNGISTSEEENIIYKKLCTKYKYVERQYYSKEYPFLCDFYVQDVNLYIEYQGYWSHGKDNVEILGPFDSNNIKHQELLKKWKEKAITSKQYQSSIKTWTKSDPLKRKTAIENNLNWLEFFTIEDFEQWFNNI